MVFRICPAVPVISSWIDFVAPVTTSVILRNSRSALPSCWPTSGSFFGPKTIRAITKMITQSAGPPMPNASGDVIDQGISRPLELADGNSLGHRQHRVGIDVAGSIALGVHSPRGY